MTRVRIRVRAGDVTIVREGIGAGEAFAATPGQAHERAIKASETDATKRALSTFGNCFGLSLYRDKREVAPEQQTKKPIAAGEPSRPTTTAAHRVAAKPGAFNGFETRRPVDKSELPIGEPRRVRSAEHLRAVAKEPCLICGRQPSHAHHLRFMQPRAIGRKVSDEFTVPLCSFHHDEVHRTGNEFNWWRARGIDPAEIAHRLWTQSHRSGPLDPLAPHSASEDACNSKNAAPMVNSDGTSTDRIGVPTAR